MHKAFRMWSPQSQTLWLILCCISRSSTLSSLDGCILNQEMGTLKTMSPQSMSVFIGLWVPEPHFYNTFCHCCFLPHFLEFPIGELPPNCSCPGCSPTFVFFLKQLRLGLVCYCGTSEPIQTNYTWECCPCQPWVISDGLSTLLGTGKVWTFFPFSPHRDWS